MIVFPCRHTLPFVCLLVVAFLHLARLWIAKHAVGALHAIGLGLGGPVGAVAVLDSLGASEAATLIPSSTLGPLTWMQEVAVAVRWSPWRT